MEYKVLIADDEAPICSILSSELEQAGFATTIAYDGKEVLALCSKEAFDCVVLDMQMPYASGMECVRSIKKEAPNTIAIIMTAFASIERAVEAMKMGADDYIAKPFDAAELIEKLRQLLKFRDRKKSVDWGTSAAPISIIGQSAAYDQMRVLIQKVSRSNATVLITGESGTGKSVVARSIYSSGEGATRPFVHVTCSALPLNLVESELFGHEKGAFTSALSMTKGKFELAEDGTIFLDEIGTLSLELQAKLLTVLQERAFFRVGGTRPIQMRARVIAATNEDLELAVANGRFRSDLYYRLNVIRIECPPLRVQPEALDQLAPYFLDKYASQNGFSQRILLPDAMDAIRAYDWPGNVRELENVIESILVLSEQCEITVEDLPSKLRKKAAFPYSNTVYDRPLSLQEQELSSIVAALERNNGHREKTAKDLGISIRTLHYKLKRFNLGL